MALALRPACSKLHHEDSVGAIISRIFAFAGIRPGCGVSSSLQALCKILMPVPDTHRGSATKDKPPSNGFCKPSSNVFSSPSLIGSCKGVLCKTATGFRLGDKLQVWSASSHKWFDDGEVQEVRSDGCLFIRYNSLKPSGKWIPAAVAHRLLRHAAASARIPLEADVVKLKNMEHPVPVTTSPLKVCKGIFASCIVFVSPLGGTYMTSQRRELLRTRLQEAGGIAPDFLREDVTHLVVVPEVTDAVLQSEYRELRQGPTAVSFLTDLWICNSLAQGRRLPETYYKWRRSTRKPEPEQPTTPEPYHTKRERNSDAQSPCKRRMHVKGEDGRPQDPGTNGMAGRAFFKNGDWSCPRCSQHNFRKRAVCRRAGCGFLRP